MVSRWSPSLTSFLKRAMEKRVAREAISLYVESLKADGEEVPVERGVETTAVEIMEPVA